jgi:hypothetical protein
MCVCRFVQREAPPMPMRFETRSRETVLDDLTKKVGELPLNHPDRPALVRMIDGLRAEIALPGNGDADVSRKERQAQHLV